MTKTLDTRMNLVQFYYIIKMVQYLRCFISYQEMVGLEQWAVLAKAFQFQALRVTINSERRTPLT